MTSINVNGEVAIVTGAGRGIGRAIADGLHAAGAIVVALDLAFDEGPYPYETTDIDLRDTAAISAVLGDAAQRHGGLSALVNCAGISRPAQLADLDDSTWDQVHDIDLKAPILAIQAALPLLRTPASIVNVTSIRATRGFAGDVAYLAAKGGLAAATRGLAIELGPRGVRVNSVAPGAIETALNKQVLSDPAHRERVLNRIPLGRIGAPEDIAGAVVFLVSSASSFVTGSVIAIDGGQSAAG